MSGVGKGGRPEQELEREYEERKDKLLEEIQEARDNGTLLRQRWGEDLLDVFTDPLSSTEETELDVFSTDRRQIAVNQRILRDEAQAFLSEIQLTAPERNKLVDDLLKAYEKVVEEQEQEEEEEHGHVFFDPRRSM